MISIHCSGVNVFITVDAHGRTYGTKSATYNTMANMYNTLNTLYCMSSLKSMHSSDKIPSNQVNVFEAEKIMMVTNAQCLANLSSYSSYSLLTSIIFLFYYL